MSEKIFRNADVYDTLPKGLFNIGDVKNIGFIPGKEEEFNWFCFAPKHTIVRVNTLATTVHALKVYLDETLTKESEKRHLPVPGVYQHGTLTDCLVISPWRYDGPLSRHSHEVIVDGMCGAAVLRGANVFAPGVMGVIPTTEEGDLVSVYADSGGRCRRGLGKPFIDPGKIFVGNGIMRMSRKQLFEKDLHPKGIAVEMTHPASGVAAVDIPQQLGLMQNLPSAVCGHVLSPQPGEKVIDLCAAPGHKTTHLAALMENEGVLVALEKIALKIEPLRQLCQTMHAGCVRAFQYDSTKAVSSDPGSDWTPPFAPNTFDRVLLDAPCSALGQRPQIGSRLSSRQIKSYPKFQKKFFTTAVQLVRPGGALVYSTCSLTTEENEGIVSWALSAFPQMQLVPAHPLLGRPGNKQPGLSEAECQMVQRFGPPIGDKPEQDTIGFFIAKFIKVS